MKYLLILLLVSFQSLAVEKWHEADYVNHFCKGKIEYVLPDKTRVDCLTNIHAIEYDYSRKWAESLGQALYYSARTGKKTGIVLIVNPKHKGRYLTRLNEAIDMIPCKPSEVPCVKVWIVDEKL